MITRPFSVLQALGEYGGLTGSGSTAVSSGVALARDAMAWVSDHRVLVGAVVIVVILWVLFPSRSPR